MRHDAPDSWWGASSTPPAPDRWCLVKRAWKPGDVAVIEWHHEEARGRSFAVRTSVDWIAFDAEVGRILPGDVWDARPLVVIDPEDREALDELTKALVQACYDHGNVTCANNGIHPDTTQAALRSLIAPPKPEEPTGLGAVVEDADKKLWTKTSSTVPNCWMRSDDYGAKDWADLDAVRVLSEGVDA